MVVGVGGGDRVIVVDIGVRERARLRIHMRDKEGKKAGKEKWVMI